MCYIKHTYFVVTVQCRNAATSYDDVIKWKHFPRYWPFGREIHRSAMNSAHKGQWRGALIFSSICAWINGWVNNREAVDLRRHRVHYDVTVVLCSWETGSCALNMKNWFIWSLLHESIWSMAALIWTIQIPVWKHVINLSWSLLITNLQY